MAIIHAGFDTRRLGGLTFRVTEATGPSTFSVSIPDKRLAHFLLIGSFGDGYEVTANVLKAELDAGSPNAWTYTVTYSHTAGTFTISASGGNIALDFNSDGQASVNARQALGFGATSANASSHTSPAKAFYVIHTLHDGLSNVSEDYEPHGIVRGVISDSGQSFAVAPLAAPVHFDFRVPFERKQAVFKHEATATVPWTFEHLFEHCRGDLPFRVSWVYSPLHLLRPEGASFRPTRAWDDFDDAWHIDFETYVDR